MQPCSRAAGGWPKISNPFLQDDIYPLLSDVGFVKVFTFEKDREWPGVGVRFSGSG
jgi:hypothetical protein